MGIAAIAAKKNTEMITISSISIQKITNAIKKSGMKRIKKGAMKMSKSIDIEFLLE